MLAPPILLGKWPYLPHQRRNTATILNPLTTLNGDIAPVAAGIGLKLSPFHGALTNSLATHPSERNMVGLSCVCAALQRPLVDINRSAPPASRPKCIYLLEY